MNEPKTIGEVVIALDAVMHDCLRTSSRAGYFAALYKRMTMAVADGITAGVFEDGPRMERLDLVFAWRYLAAYRAHFAGKACTQSWQETFTSHSDDSLTVLQHLLPGINSHINFDLAIAAATVAPGDTIHPLQNDFNRINDVIAALIDDVQGCLEAVWFPMRLLRSVVNRQGRPVLNFSISLAREIAWSNAVQLAVMNETQRTKFIETMDASVVGIGRRINKPGVWPQLLLKLVRLTECQDVNRTIGLVGSTVVRTVAARVVGKSIPAGRPL